MKREEFLRVAALMAGTSAVTGFASVAKTTSEDAHVFHAAHKIIPITSQERRQRVARLQQQMVQNNMEGLILEGGTSLEYFTGISWWLSERLMTAFIPAEGEIIYICPGFEESRFQELITIGGKVFVWREDENPYAQVAHAFSELGIHAGKIGIEEQLRFFVFDGIRKATPNMEYADGGSVIMPCRMIKSAAELALMQQASDITVAAIKSGINALKEGISPGEIADVIDDAHRKMGATPDFADILFGEASANPHGSIKPQRLKKGDIVLMDCGCKLEGYCSDITRTIVFGDKPTKRQQDIWDLEHKAQAAGFAAAGIGVPCESIDAAARKIITDAGFGPGYKLPGLPHRTGHGIGMDGHEPAYIVKGNQLKLRAGMCFSIEPTISLPGEFGVRLEDCVYMTEEGPKWFSQPAVSIDKPFG